MTEKDQSQGGEGPIDLFRRVVKQLSRRSFVADSSKVGGDALALSASGVGTVAASGDGEDGDGNGGNKDGGGAAEGITDLDSEQWIGYKTPAELTKMNDSQEATADGLASRINLDPKSRRAFLKKAAVSSAAIGLGLGGTGTALASGPGDGDGCEDESGSDGELQKPVRADQPTEPVRQLLNTLDEQNVPHINTLSTEEARQLFSKFFTGPTEQKVGNVENRSVSGPNGDIPVRIYWPQETEFSEPLPVSLYMHGGGWVLGGLDTHDSVARSLTNASQGMLVAIDYRLGPEQPFPAAVEDCWAVAKWVANNAASMGADPSRMAATGESAGGGMTAVLTYLAKNDDAVNFVHQLPIYPVTDLSGSWVGQLPDTFSIVNPEDEQQLERRYLVPEDLVWFGDRYLPYEYAAQNLYTSPLLAREERLHDLPPATVVTTGFGPLGDQGYLYAKQLQEAGVSVDVTHYPAMIHDFFNMEYLTDPYPDIPTAGEAKENAGATLREAFSQHS